MKNRESQAVKHLLSQSQLPYKHVLAGLEELDVSGWRNVRSKAVYDLTSPQKLKHSHRYGGRAARAHKPRSLLQQPVMTNSGASCMSGELDQHFNYIYKGGLSRYAGSAGPLSHLPPPPPLSSYQRYRLPSTLHLDPAFPHHSANQMRPEGRLDLAQIVAMQLKPELLVEQIVIENRLRTMNIGSLSHLSYLEGIGVDPKSIHDLDKGMWLQAAARKSTPLLSGLQTQHRKTNKRRVLRRFPMALDWCTLNADASNDVHVNPVNPGGLMEGNNYGMEGRDHLNMDERSRYNMEGYDAEGRGHYNTEAPLLQVGSPLSVNTRYRLPQLSFQTAANPSQFSTRGLRGSVIQREHVREGAGKSLHIPVVSPSLRTERGGEASGLGSPEGYWHAKNVKFVNKLSSLGW